MWRLSAHCITSVNTYLDDHIVNYLDEIDNGDSFTCVDRVSRITQVLQSSRTLQPLRVWCQSNGLRSYWINTDSPAQSPDMAASKSLGLVLSAAFSLQWGLANKTILKYPTTGREFVPFFLDGRNAAERLHEESQRIRDWLTPHTFLRMERGKDS